MRQEDLTLRYFAIVQGPPDEGPCCTWEGKPV